MANQEHLDILKQGVQVWNQWRQEHPDVRPYLREVSLEGVNLEGVNFTKADLIEANLSKAQLCDANLSATDLRGSRFYKANLSKANLSGADLSDADFTKTYLREANLTKAMLIRTLFNDADLIMADLRKAKLGATLLLSALLAGADLRGTEFSMANLSMANLFKADLRGANLGLSNLSMADFSKSDLGKANLSGANLGSANFNEANLTGCRIYGISAWNVQLEGTIQSNLIITPPDEPIISVDNLEVAQFIYLLLNNQKIRDVISTITSKVVLILGRFTKERKPVLDALRDELRKYNFSPVVFDFDPSAKRDLTETISILAHLSRFIIADITDAKSIPQELERIVPYLPSVPVQPILHKDGTEYAMFEHYRQYPWVLPIYHYQDIPSLLASIKEHIITPVEQKEYEKGKMKALEEEIRKLKEENKKLREGR